MFCTYIYVVTDKFWYDKSRHLLYRGTSFNFSRLYSGTALGDIHVVQTDTLRTIFFANKNIVLFLLFPLCFDKRKPSFIFMLSWRKPVADCGKPRPHTNGSELQAVRQPSWPRVQGRTEAHRSPLLRQLRLSGLYAGGAGSCNSRRRRP